MRMEHIVDSFFLLIREMDSLLGRGRPRSIGRWTMRREREFGSLSEKALNRYLMDFNSREVSPTMKQSSALVTIRHGLSLSSEISDCDSRTNKGEDVTRKGIKVIGRTIS